MPDDIDDQDHGGDAMKDAADVESPFERHEGLENLKFVENKRQSGHDQDGEGEDQEKMLNPFGKVHPQEDFVVADEVGGV
jgi:hypothetical protein